MLNLFTQLNKMDEDFQFELVSYSNESEIRECLQDGSCLASLKYSDEEALVKEQKDTSDLYKSIALPILDDPVISCTIP